MITKHTFLIRLRQTKVIQVSFPVFICLDKKRVSLQITITSVVPWDLPYFFLSSAHGPPPPPDPVTSVTITNNTQETWLEHKPEPTGHWSSLLSANTAANTLRNNRAVDFSRPTHCMNNEWKPFRLFFAHQLCWVERYTWGFHSASQAWTPTRIYVTYGAVASVIDWC